MCCSVLQCVACQKSSVFVLAGALPARAGVVCDMTHLYICHDAFIHVP